MASKALVAIGSAVHQALPALRRIRGTRAGYAVWRLTGDPAELVEPLLDNAARFGESRAVALLVEMNAGRAAAGLAELAERDERSINSGDWNDTVWEDERFQQELRAAAAALAG